MSQDPPPDAGPPRGAVVALVASAGGIEAVAATLEALPPRFPAAVVVLVHQDPARPASSLTEVLGRRTALPVALARHGGGLRAGQVLVIPPGRHLLVTPRREVSLLVSGEFPPNRPSADLLLASMATALGADAVAVVLSGGGHDGATGATAVHVHGGTVLATDEASSTVFSMPSATIRRDHAVDHVVALHALPALLGTLVG